VSLESDRPPPELTPAQRKLFDDEPGLAEDAVNAVMKELGAAIFGHFSREEMLSIATLGALEATTTFEPAAGQAYRIWGFFAAVRRVLDCRREDHARHAKTRALLRANVLVYFGSASAEVEVGVDTDASLANKLHGFTSPTLALAVLEVAAQEPTTGGEDEVVEREAAARAGDALRQALPAAGTDERRMFDLHFGEHKPLTEVATAMGVDKAGYRTFVRRFHEALAALREELAKRGIKKIPPWREDASGRALDEGG
jgi:DNA-directed RNA polymerase specialized sigma24 family protein